MLAQQRQSGISLTGFIVLLFVFVAVAFGVGWFANTYYANRLFLVDGLVPDFPSVTEVDALIKPLLQGKIKADDIPAYVDSLRSRYSGNEVRQILNATLEEVPQKSISTALQSELNNIVDTGEIDYSDDEPIEAGSVKIKYFRTTIENGDLVANWKVIVGSDILSGIDAPRPQQIPDDYDFYTFIQYTINIKNLATGTEEELDYDFFEDEDEQKDVILLQNIKPGEYQIDIEMDAQYYTETAASHYNGKLEIKVNY
jgi:hypothetical protein